MPGENLFQTLQKILTAVQRLEYFVVDDHHFLTPDVVNYAAGFGAQVVNLPDLIVALDTATGSVIL